MSAIYIIRQKLNHQILFQKEYDKHEDFNLKRDFPSFLVKTMELGWTNSPIIPPYFKIGEERKIEELPHPGTIFINGSPFPLGYKTEGDKVVTRTAYDLVEEGIAKINQPFEFVLRDGTLGKRTIEEVFKLKVLDSIEACKNYLDVVRKTIQDGILQQYPLFEQLQLTKAYIAWLQEEKRNQKKEDSRYREYVQMESTLDAIRKKYQPMIDYAKQRLKELEGGRDVSDKNTKEEIKKYMDENGISYTSKETKAQLIKKINTVKK